MWVIFYIATNVFATCFVWGLKLCLPKCLNKDTMFLGICKMKIRFAERP